MIPPANRKRKVEVGRGQHVRFQLVLHECLLNQITMATMKKAASTTTGMPPMAVAALSVPLAAIRRELSHRRHRHSVPSSSNHLVLLNLDPKRIRSMDGEDPKRNQWTA